MKEISKAEAETFNLSGIVRTGQKDEDRRDKSHQKRRNDYDPKH